MTLQIQESHSLAGVDSFDGMAGSHAVTASTSLLPPPGAAGLTGTQDALAMLFSVIAKQGELTAAIGQSSVVTAKREQETQLDKERKAIQQEIQAEASAGGFWNALLSFAEGVLKVVGIVVAAAAAAVATVFTAGTAGIAIVSLGAVLLSSGAVVSATGCLGKDSGLFGMGMEIVGSILTLGATSSAVATTAVESTAQTVNSVGSAVGGVAGVVAGVSTIVVGKFQSDAENDAADVQNALNLINQQTRSVADLIAGLKSDSESNQSALQTIGGAAQTYNQTLTTAASGGRA